MRSGQQWSTFLGLMLSLALITGCTETKTDVAGGKPAQGTAAQDTKGAAAPAATPTVTDKPGCEGAVVPSAETIEKGEYTPLSRPLFVYVNKKALKKPEVAGYVKMMLGKAQELIEARGFIKLNESELKAQQAKLDAEIADVKIPEKIVGGSISADGSSTVFPFAAIAAELFEKANEDVHVTIGKKGTGGGFEKFSTGETDISNASRPIKTGEAEKCAKSGVEFIELTVCIDGLTVCVNPANDWCHCMSIEQLKALWKPDSKIKKWSELNPAWPAEDIKLFAPDTDSGTFDYFTEVVVGKTDESRSDYSASSEDNYLVKGIEGDKYALGYFGYSYYDKNRSKLKALGIIPAAKAEKTEKKAEAK